MRVLTPELEQAHWNAVVKAGVLSGIVGLGVGLGGVTLAHRRYAAFRAMTLPFKAFLVSSSGTAFGMIAADHESIEFDRQHDTKMVALGEANARAREERRANESSTDRALRWGRENRYKIVAGSWAAGMAGAWHYVNKDKLLTTSQKIVQVRMYAQALCVLVLVATAALEMSDVKKGEGRWESVMVVDPKDPKHAKRVERQQVHESHYSGQDLWKDMVVAEEKRLQERDDRRAAATTGSGPDGDK